MASPRVFRVAQSICSKSPQRQLPTRRFHVSATRRSVEESRLPRVASPSFWASLIPRVLRRPTDAEAAAERAKVRAAGWEERRTAIAFLVLGILVGSNAINLIAIRRDMLNFTRQTDAKLALLRDVVQRVKDGEDVDVKKALGTGNAAEEKEWEQVMHELETTDMLWEGRQKREAKRVQKQQQSAPAAQETRTGADASSTKDDSAVPSRPKFLM